MFQTIIVRLLALWLLGLICGVGLKVSDPLLTLQLYHKSRV